jgi:hypothetical protein
LEAYLIAPEAFLMPIHLQPFAPFVLVHFQTALLFQISHKTIAKIYLSGLTIQIYAY